MVGSQRKRPDEAVTTAAWNHPPSLGLHDRPPQLGGWTMPAKSKAQQKAAGAALAAKRGDIPKSMLKGASKSMAESMTENELDELASTKRKGKPEHVTKH
jgi:hypothetical protein